MEEIFKPIKEGQEVNLMNPLVWAYVGDCIYELYIRTYLINNTKHKVHQLHIEATKYVKASSQAQILKDIEQYLTRRRKRYSKKNKKHTEIITCLKMQIQQTICMQQHLRD